MKALVAATCLIVMAAAGYYLWSAYQENIGRDERAAFLAAREECLTGFRTVEFGEADITRCIVNGHVSESEFRAELEKMRKP